MNIRLLQEEIRIFTGANCTKMGSRFLYVFPTYSRPRGELFQVAIKLIRVSNDGSGQLEELLRVRVRQQVHLLLL
jgi:hypothetical protein